MLRKTIKSRILHNYQLLCSNNTHSARLSTLSFNITRPQQHRPSIHFQSTVNVNSLVKPISYTHFMAMINNPSTSKPTSKSTSTTESRFNQLTVDKLFSQSLVFPKNLASLKDKLLAHFKTIRLENLICEVYNEQALRARQKSQKDTEDEEDERDIDSNVDNDVVRRKSLNNTQVYAIADPLNHRVVVGSIAGGRFRIAQSIGTGYPNTLTNLKEQGLENIPFHLVSFVAPTFVCSVISEPNCFLVVDSALNCVFKVDLVSETLTNIFQGSPQDFLTDYPYSKQVAVPITVEALLAEMYPTLFYYPGYEMQPLLIAQDDAATSLNSILEAFKQGLLPISMEQLRDKLESHSQSSSVDINDSVFDESDHGNSYNNNNNHKNNSENNNSFFRKIFKKKNPNTSLLQELLQNLTTPSQSKSLLLPVLKYPWGNLRNLNSPFPLAITSSILEFEPLTPLPFQSDQLSPTYLSSLLVVPAGTYQITIKIRQFKQTQKQNHTKQGQDSDYGDWFSHSPNVSYSVEGSISDLRIISILNPPKPKMSEATRFEYDIEEEPPIVEPKDELVNQVKITPLQEVTGLDSWGAECYNSMFVDMSTGTGKVRAKKKIGRQKKKKNNENCARKKFVVLFLIF